MTRDEIIARLVQLPGEIKQADVLLLSRVDESQRTRDFLVAREVSLTLIGLEGKNAEERKAKLTLETEQERYAVQKCESAVAAQRVELNALRDEFSALRTVATLLTGEAAS